MSSFYLQSLASVLITKELSAYHKNIYFSPTPPVLSVSKNFSCQLSEKPRGDHFVPLLLGKKMQVQEQQHCLVLNPHRLNKSLEYLFSSIGAILTLKLAL